MRRTLIIAQIAALMLIAVAGAYGSGTPRAPCHSEAPQGDTVCRY
ncbi:hypothetical protein [Roseovarius salinarum]|nr:hypothetical protein [Roseovarius salinarum]